mgnify:CR=1 FL=1
MRSARRFDAQVCTRISPSDRISALRASRLFEPSVSTPRSIFEHDESTSSARSAGLEVRASSAVDSRSTQPGRWSLTSRDVGFVRTEPGVSQATVDQHTRQSGTQGYRAHRAIGHTGLSGTQGYRAHREIGPTGRSRSPAPRRRMVGDGRRKMDEGKRPRGNGRGETERTGSFPVDPRESPLRPALRPARSPARPRNTKGAGGF